MVVIEKGAQRAYVLDTNVLIHDPQSFFQFAEHDIVLPMTVLEELDKLKLGRGEVSHNARAATRTLSQLMADVPQSEIDRGIRIPNHGSRPSGRLFLHFTEKPKTLPGLDDSVADNRILSEFMQIRDQRGPDTTLILVTKDVNLLVKAAAAKIPAEDYRNDRVIDDVEAMSTGCRVLPEGYWDRLQDNQLEAWNDGGVSRYSWPVDDPEDWHPGQYVCEEKPHGMEGIVQSVADDRVVMRMARNYRTDKAAVWGVHARNCLQNAALNFLMDPDIHLVTIGGSAGTGKTLLALAAGLAQIMDDRVFDRIVVTRETVAAGEDIGYLPGSEEEKLLPWHGAVQDNLETLISGPNGWSDPATRDMLGDRIQLKSPGLLRGRNFARTWLIIDEAQNLTAKQVKTLVTRAGEGTKVICMGNLAQLDTPYLSPTTSGFTYLVEKFKHWDKSAHITLEAIERSPLAEQAERIL